MKRLFPHAALLGIAFALGACAPEKVSGPTQQQDVMAAQYASRRAGEPPAMQNAEGDVIYKNYIENIGKPLEGKNDRTMVQSR